MDAVRPSWHTFFGIHRVAAQHRKCTPVIFVAVGLDVVQTADNRNPGPLNDLHHLCLYRGSQNFVVLSSYCQLFGIPLWPFAAGLDVHLVQLWGILFSCCGISLQAFFSSLSLNRPGKGRGDWVCWRSSSDCFFASIAISHIQVPAQLRSMCSILSVVDHLVLHRVYRAYVDCWLHQYI